MCAVLFQVHELSRGDQEPVVQTVTPSRSHAMSIKQEKDELPRILTPSRSHAMSIKQEKDKLPRRQRCRQS